MKKKNKILIVLVILLLIILNLYLIDQVNDLTYLVANLEQEIAKQKETITNLTQLTLDLEQEIAKQKETIINLTSANEELQSIASLERVPADLKFKVKVSVSEGFRFIGAIVFSLGCYYVTGVFYKFCGVA